MRSPGCAASRQPRRRSPRRAGRSWNVFERTERDMVMFEINLPQAAHPFPILQTSFAEDERDELRRLWRTSCVHPSLELVSRSVSSGVEGAGLWFRLGTIFAVYVPGTFDRCPYVAHGRTQKIV